MTDLRVITSNGTDAVLKEAAVQAFADSLRGPLLRQRDAGYDEARRVWNGMIDRSPVLIARCAGVADVINSVNFARTHRLLVAVRGGGHNVAGNAICDGGLTIDLSGMQSIRVDPVQRTARAEVGATWGEFDRETQTFGLATPGGQISTTGVAGLTLGGGWGHLARRYGLASDNLISADLVTGGRQFPDGQQDPASRLVLGSARRRRQFWRRHFSRISASSGRACGRRPCRVSDGEGKRSPRSFP